MLQNRRLFADFAAAPRCLRKAGNLSNSEKERIHRKADAVLDDDKND